MTDATPLARTDAAGLSLAVARHAATISYAALPAATVAAARRALLDGIGVMLAASGVATEVRPFVDVARRSGPGPAPMLGFADGVQPAMAALVNGAMAHALDFEDVHDAGPAHPNASLLPAVLALIAQEGAPISGQDLIAAIAMGGDLTCRMTLAVTRPMEEGGWFPPPILGGFGAAAAGARVLGLDARGVLDAFSLLMCQNTCPGEIKNARDTVLRAVREAFPAQAAVVSVNLARAGVRGFDAPIEGEQGFYRAFAGGQYDPAALLSGLGTDFAVEALSFKPWPACRGTHAYIEAAEVLMHRHGFGAGDVAAVEAVGGTVQRMLVEPLARKRAPATAIDAKFSIPFCVGAAIVHGRVDLDSFAPAARADPAVLALAARVSFDEQDWPRARAAAGGLRIRLNDGTTVAHHVENPRGHPSNPLDDAALVEKFLMCAAHAAEPMPRATAEALAERILTIDAAPDCAAHLGWRTGPGEQTT